MVKCAQNSMVKRRNGKKKSITSSRTTHPHSSNRWADKAIKSDTYELCDKRNEASSRPSSGFDNPFVLHQQRTMTPADTEWGQNLYAVIVSQACFQVRPRCCLFANTKATIVPITIHTLRCKEQAAEFLYRYAVFQSGFHSSVIKPNSTKYSGQSQRTHAAQFGSNFM